MYALYTQCNGEPAFPYPSPVTPVVNAKVSTIACPWMEGRFAFVPPIGTKPVWETKSVERKFYE